MTAEERIQFFLLLRLKLDEIEEIMEDYGGKEKFLSAWCFGVYVPEENEDTPERYELMTGMHMAMEEEFDLMSDTMVDCFENRRKEDGDENDSGTIDYWINK